MERNQPQLATKLRQAKITEMVGRQRSGKESGNVGAGGPSERTLEKSDIPIVGRPSQWAKSNL